MSAGRILVVEDDLVVGELLTLHLDEAGYETVWERDGARAWDRLRADRVPLDAVVLDRLLPGLDGMEILARIKSCDSSARLPVIMQTALSSPEEVVEGLRAGAHYYLPKPFSPEALVEIVRAAVGDHRMHSELREAARQTVRCLAHIRSGEFVFRTLEEAREIATALANAGPNPSRVVPGLTELMLNAVEHGNLALSYDDKGTLIREDRLYEEIERRLGSPPYAARAATVTVERTEGETRYVIRDQGEGFDWRQYLEISAERAFDPHGRGIAMSRLLSFDLLEYRGCGNEVLAVVRD